MFYCSFIKSVLTYCLVCCVGALSVKKIDKFNSIVNRGRQVVGVKQTGLNQLYDRSAQRKRIETMSELGHILSLYYATFRQESQDIEGKER